MAVAPEDPPTSCNSQYHGFRMAAIGMGTVTGRIRVRSSHRFALAGLSALALLGADPSQVADAARRGADAWWALLDEREDEAPASAELCSHH